MIQKLRNEERDMSRLVRKHWRGWQTFHEPGLGADAGIPDWETLLWGRCVHIEFKVAVMHSFFVRSETIRPAQMSWHRDAEAAGVPCAFLFGVFKEQDVWDLFIGHWTDIENNWKGGMQVGRGLSALGPISNIHQSLTNYAFNKWNHR